MHKFRYSLHQHYSKRNSSDKSKDSPISQNSNEENDSTKLSSSSLQDLHDDLDDIYNNYTLAQGTNNNSVDTLDSENNQAINKFIDKPPAIHGMEPQLPVMHVSSRLSSLGNTTNETGESIAKSAPGTPLSSHSFDFRPHHPRAVTNSSLNVLLDTPNVSSEFNHLVDQTPPNESVERFDDSNNTVDNTEEEENNDDTDEIPKSETLKQNEENWEKKGAAVKTIKTMDGEMKTIRRNVTDFKFGKELGEGSYSTVILATDKITGKQYAVKVLDKRHIIKEKKVKYVNIEKHALNRLSNRLGVISLYFTFQDKDSLYFVLDYASNGELLTLIKRYNTLNEECTRHFGAQILDAIKYMHDNGVIHRDLKPENILLDDKMRIQITDFGTARLLEKKNDESEEYPVDVRAKSFVGTAEYVSPELLENKYCGKPGDIWAFGCIIYQMIAGKPPFKATNEYLTFQKITKLQFAFSAGFPTIIRDLIKKILVLQPSRRATIPEIQKHYFFQSVDFKDFDLIWLSDPPEIGPYKMTAKSMMKVPELNKAPVTTVIKKNVKKSTNSNSNTNNVATAVGGGSSNGHKGSSPTPEKEPSPATINNKSTEKVSAASVAAYVLNKPATNQNSSTSEDSSKRSSNSNETRKLSYSQQDYIPGTNILRPQISTRPSVGSYVKTTPSKDRKTLTKVPLNIHQQQEKVKPKVMEVKPATTLEAAWEPYLTHPDERILRIGPVIAHKEPTEPFEKKNKASLHISPLDINKEQRSRSNTSLLTQIVNEVNNNTSELKKVENADESLAIIEPQYNMKRSPTSDSKKSMDIERSASTSGSRISKKAIFKKLGFSHLEKNDSEESNGPSLTEKPQTCTLVVTTHGRALLFIRNDIESNYLLIAEIKLKYPFIHFQELVISQTKFSKLVPSVGVFVISSIDNSLIFEVEKFEVNQWTEALAKSKYNEIERGKLAAYESQVSLKEPVVIKKQSSSTYNTTRSSPKLLDAPAFDSSVAKTNNHKKSQQHSSPTVRKSSETSSPSSHSPRTAATNMFKMKLQSGTPKRKPPPPVSPPQELNSHTGLPRRSTENGTLHAAQLAVSQVSPKGYSNNRRSSFTKEDGSKIDPNKMRKAAHTYNHSHSHNGNNGNSNSNSNGNKSGSGVTALNSKFLARSTRKK